MRGSRNRGYAVRLGLPATVFMIAGVLTGCLSTHVRVWQADNFDPQNYRNYHWASPPLTGESGISPDMSAIDATVRREVDRALAQKGYSRGEPAAFEIDYRVGGETLISRPGPLTPREVGDRVRAGPNAEYEVSSDFTTHRVNDVLEIRRILVTVLDTDTEKTVWEGVAARPVDTAGSSARAIARSVRTAVDKLMRRFPVAGAGGDGGTR